MPDAAVNEHHIETNGVTLRVLDAGEGPAVLLAHGFPELGYSWRHQIQPLAAAGLDRVCISHALAACA